MNRPGWLRANHRRLIRLSMPGLTGALRKAVDQQGKVRATTGGFCGVLKKADTRCTLYLLHSGSWQVSFVAALAAEEPCDLPGS